MSIFNTNKITNNDPLREEKIDALNRIKDYLQGLAKRDWAPVIGLSNSPRFSVLEEHLYSIIEMYKLSRQKEDSDLQAVANGDAYFSENWYEKIINSTDRGQINKIYGIVEKALLTYSGLLTRELKKIASATQECWATAVYEDEGPFFETVSGFETFNELESPAVLRKKLTKFDTKFPFSVNNGDWGKEWARKVLRDELVARIKESEEIGGEEKSHNEIFKRVEKILREIKFYRTKGGRFMVIHAYDADDENEWTVNNFKTFMKGSHMIGSEYLRDDYLPNGQKKADLLRKLEEVIEAGIKKIENNDAQSNTTANTNANDNDKVSETSDSEATADSNVSSIFDESDEEEKKEEITTDNSSVNSSDNNLNDTDPAIVKRAKVRYAQMIRDFLKQEPAVKEEELKEENLNWLEKINAAGSFSEVINIWLNIDYNVRCIRKSKQESVKLDDIIENPLVDNENFVNHFQTINNNLGEGENEIKAQKAKAAIIKNDPEAYFDYFVNWIKEEEKKLEEERKTLEEAEASSEIEFNEEEKQFLAGQVTNPAKKEAIAQAIEVKINVKKKTWSLWKWIKAQTKWIKTKAKLLAKNNKVGFEQKKEQIKQEIKNGENNSNIYTRQVYKNNQNQTQALLRELENISSGNTNSTVDNNKFPVGLVMGVGAILLTVMLMAGLIIRRRKINKKK